MDYTKSLVNIPDIWKIMIYNSLISNFVSFFVDAILVYKTEHKFQMLFLARRDLLLWNTENGRGPGVLFHGLYKVFTILPRKEFIIPVL